MMNEASAREAFIFTGATMARTILLFYRLFLRYFEEKICEFKKKIIFNRFLE